MFTVPFRFPLLPVRLTTPKYLLASIVPRHPHFVSPLCLPPYPCDSSFLPFLFPLLPSIPLHPVRPPSFTPPTHLAACLPVSEAGICAQVLKGEFDLSSEPWPLVSPSVKDLIRRMLEPDVSKRIKVTEILGERAIE